MINPVAELLLLVAGTITIGGVFVTRWWRVRSDKHLIRQRLELLLNADAESMPMMSADTEPDWFQAAEARFAGLAKLRALMDRAEIKTAPSTAVWLALIISGLAAAAAGVAGLPAILCAVLFVILLSIPYVVLYFIAEAKRNKFVDQLPDALDLMISVLRSGLSIPQAIKAVAEEMPAPCGTEFAQVLHRINLGQSLTEALQQTTERYRLFELELFRRATAIQTEVGGSLAELLDKTNGTLRQRIRLKRQVRVYTAQSRLSGSIIALLPFVVAIGFQFLNPGYLKPLVQTDVGHFVVIAALSLQICGILTIRKMSTFKV